ncbi:hypothetical protein [Arthrobacter globiformis]|uniref:Uncharacterized protein n=1 Tax=Arthrobacter globiformis TaxID=1665 RepID=A0A328HGF5_ARTGO|nr:hypothetical protein [Arthrobacter globiformis]RAM37214.1 hypothetical protein DBZ45_11270 [Arthrobacter globiformis]
MNESPRSPRFSAERSAAVEALLANVVRDGTSENRHFQNTKGKRILLAGVAIALVATGGAVIMQLPVADKSSIDCFARAELHGSRFPGTTVVLGEGTRVGEPSTQRNPIPIEDALAACRHVWAQHVLDPDAPDGRTHPSLRDGSSSYPVPDPLTVCVLNDGRAAVIPGDEKVCGSLGLALKTPTAP